MNHTESNQNKMAVMPMGKLVLNMSLPIMISLLIQSLYNIVDSIFVARLSEKALTATSLAYPVQMLMIAVGVGTAVGVNALLSQTLGAKKYEEASHVAMMGLILSVISSAVFTLAGLFLAGKLSYTFTTDAETAALCSSYLWICMVFCLGNMVCMVFQRLLQASGNAFWSMIILVSGAITNIVLDPIMIFGLLGFPALGIKGAAIATVAGQWVSMVVGLFLNIKKNTDVRLTLKNFQWKKERVAAIYRVGLPTIIMQVLNSMMVTAFNAILIPVSSTAVAFFGIYYKLQNFLFMPMNGLGQAAIPIVGYNYGAKNRDRIIQSVKVLYPVAVIIALIGTIIFQVFGNALLQLFSASENMIAIGIPALRIISITFVFAAFTMITGYIGSGMRDGITNMIGSVLRQFIPLIPCAYLILQMTDIRDVWYAFWISEAAAFVYALFRLRKMLHSLNFSQYDK